MGHYVDETIFDVADLSGVPLMGVVNPSSSPATGALVVVALDSSRRIQVAGTFSVTPIASNSLGQQNRVAVGASLVTLLTANGSRKGLWVQNTGLTKIYLGLGFNPTTVNYVVALPMCGTPDDGSSQLWMPPILWLGTVVAIGSGPGGEVVVGEYL